MSVLCFVYNCKSNYASDVKKILEQRKFDKISDVDTPRASRPSEKGTYSTYCAPKGQLLEWRRLIPKREKVFKEKHRICSKHFTDDCFEFGVNITVEGKTFEYTYAQKRLKPDAVPTIFPGVPQHCLSTKVKKRKPPAIRFARAAEMKRKKKQAIRSDASNAEDEATEILEPKPVNPEVTPETKATATHIQAKKKRSSTSDEEEISAILETRSLNTDPRPETKAMHWNVNLVKETKAEIMEECVPAETGCLNTSSKHSYFNSILRCAKNNLIVMPSKDWKCLVFEEDRLIYITKFNTSKIVGEPTSLVTLKFSAESPAVMNVDDYVFKEAPFNELKFENVALLNEFLRDLAFNYKICIGYQKRMHDEHCEVLIPQKDFKSKHVRSDHCLTRKKRDAYRAARESERLENLEKQYKDCDAVKRSMVALALKHETLLAQVQGWKTQIAEKFGYEILDF